jgi:hypothetical protein
MRFSNREDKELFLKYAIPCGHVLVTRGDLKEQTLQKLERDLIAGKDIPEATIKKIFKVAYAMCMLIAKKSGKEQINRNVTHRYFWKEHAKAIKWRAKIYPDVVAEQCRIYRGRVLSVGERAIVLSSQGKKSFRKEFVPDLKKGDFVVTHYNYVVEKITGKY